MQWPLFLMSQLFVRVEWLASSRILGFPVADSSACSVLWFPVVLDWRRLGCRWRCVAWVLGGRQRLPGQWVRRPVLATVWKKCLWFWAGSFLGWVQLFSSVNCF